MKIKKYKIKSINPTLTLILPELYNYDKICESAYFINSLAEHNSNFTLICKSNNLDFGYSTEFELRFPLSEPDFFKFNHEDFNVLQRTQVISTFHKGTFEEIADTLFFLKQKALENNLTVLNSYKIIYKKREFSTIRKKSPHSIEIQLEVAL